MSRSIVMRDWIRLHVLSNKQPHVPSQCVDVTVLIHCSALFKQLRLNADALRCMFWRSAIRIAVKAPWFITHSNFIWRVLSFGHLTSVLKSIQELGCRHCCVAWHTKCIVLQGHYCAVGRSCRCARQQLQILWWHSWNLIVTLCVIVGSVLKKLTLLGSDDGIRVADMICCWTLPTPNV
jgi:hypothetical protein